MSEDASNLALWIKIRHSMVLTLFLSFVHLFSLVAITVSWYYGLILWLAITMGVAVLLSYIYVWRNHLLPLAPNSIIALSFNHNWRVMCNDGSHPAKLKNYFTLGPILIILRFEIGLYKRIQTVMLLPDSTSVPDIHRLRQVLSMQKFN